MGRIVARTGCGRICFLGAATTVASGGHDRIRPLGHRRPLLGGPPGRDVPSGGGGGRRYMGASPRGG